MGQSIGTDRHDEWLAYYEQFPYFSPDGVRDACHPRLREHEGPAEKAIVLVHGLTDSPYFMTAIADFFFEVLGYNVYLPLLQSHGLKDPKGMEDVKLDAWKKNVDFAVDTAAAKSAQVSIGGLSTGGTLSFYTAATNEKVDGSLYLFSAALSLAGFFGGLKEFVLRLPAINILLDSDKPLIGDNPYRYARMDLDGAKELAWLIKETDDLIRDLKKQGPFAKPVFAAHSECDTIACIKGIEDLQAVSDPERFTFFRIPKTIGVSHACVVLKEPVYALDAAEGDAPLEPANPQFLNMMAALKAMGESTR